MHGGEENKGKVGEVEKRKKGALTFKGFTLSKCGKEERNGQSDEETKLEIRSLPHMCSEQRSGP